MNQDSQDLQGSGCALGSCWSVTADVGVPHCAFLGEPGYAGNLHFPRLMAALAMSRCLSEWATSTFLGSVSHACLPSDLSFLSLYLVPINGYKQCLIISSLALSFASFVSGYSLSATCHRQFKTNAPAHCFLRTFPLCLALDGASVPHLGCHCVTQRKMGLGEAMNLVTCQRLCLYEAVFS